MKGLSSMVWEILLATLVRLLWCALKSFWYLALRASSVLALQAFLECKVTLASSVFFDFLFRLYVNRQKSNYTILKYNL